MARLRGKKSANKTVTEKPAGSASEPKKNTVAEEGNSEGEKNDTDTKSGNQAGEGSRNRINEEDDDGGIASDKKHELSVGDFVWGQTKSHLWWPGQIYDPSDASESATKSKQNDRLLVAFFGDSSFAWCLQSQLVPFTERFAEMSKQSTFERDFSAVDKALEEISRRAELKMTCSCVSEENRVGLARPEAINSGVKPGVLVPEGDIERLAIPKHEPAELLEYVRHLAQASLTGDKLELVVVRSWLSAFYRRGSGLPIYHEPEEVEGINDTNDFSIPVQVPSEEYEPSSAQAIPMEGVTLSEERLIQTKHKSVSELMGENTDVNLKRIEKSLSGDETPHEVLMASTTRRKRPRKKKTDGVQLEIEMSESPSPNTAKKNEDSGVHVDSEVDSEANDESGKSLGSRERKKSKYLSHPYTAGSQKRQLESNPDNIAKVLTAGEPMTKAANVSPTITKSNGATSKGIMSEGVHSGQKEKKIIDSMGVSISVKEVLVEVQRAGVDLTSLKSDSLEMIKRFITSYRSAVYLDGSNHTLYHKQVAERKRKSSVSESRTEENDQPRSTVTKLKKAAQAAASKGKGADKKASPVSPVVFFPPNASLPSKDEIAKGDPESGKKSSTSSKKRMSKSPTGLEMTDEKTPQVGLIKSKIRKLTRMLDKCDGKVSPEEKSSLEGEMMNLVEKLHGLAVQTST